jgi:hypothetical protein
MRYREITPPPSHPYITKLEIDPADLHRLRRMADNAPELRVLDFDDSTPDRWAVRVGCASRRVQEMIEDTWG